MLASLIIVFREALEAGIVIGIILSATKGIAGRSNYIAGGLIAGCAGAGLVALCARSISSLFAGSGQEILNAGILALAVCMLAWHYVWMARHSRTLVAELKATGQAIVDGNRSLYAIAIVIGLAVMREGSEVVLFLYGIIVSSQENYPNIFIGGLLGLLAGGAVSAILYLGLVRLPVRQLFRVTGGLIVLLAAGLAAQAEAFVAQGGLVSIGQSRLWDTSFLLKDDSLIGRTLHVFIGYTARPTAAQLVTYAATLAVIVGIGRMVPHDRPKTA
jgi:high-affinity iron transporter